MKSNKLVILMIAVIAIGMFALPSTFSLGGEQHRFKTVTGNTAAEINVFCESCHLKGSGDAIQSQLNNSTAGFYYKGASVTQKIHGSQTCQSCHAVTGGYANASNRDGTAGNVGKNAQNTHAAELPSCLKCHGGSYTGGYLNNVSAEFDPAGSEAHKDFKFTGDDDLQCIGCHTFVAKSGAPSYTFDRQAQQFGGATGITIGEGSYS